MSARVLPVLMYHHVSPSPGLVTVSPANFRAQMEDLARGGWHAADADEVAAFLAGAPLPAKSVAITFDDGYVDNYLYAYPALKEFGLKATIFGVTAWIGDGPARTLSALPALPDHAGCKAAIAAGRADEVVLRWSEIEIMRAAGVVELHSHTHTHTRWDKTLPDRGARREALAADLAASRDTLRRRLGLEDTHLCWPQGYFDADYVAIARESGFRWLYTTRRHVNRAQTPGEDIGRIDTRDRGAGWLASRLGLYTAPVIGGLYARFRGGR